VASISLYRGQVAEIGLTVVDANGDPYNLTGKTVTVVLQGRGVLRRLVAVVDSPASAGTAVATVPASAYTDADNRLVPGVYSLAVWVTDGSGQREPVYSSMLEVIDLPQVD
jgi:hypothetical protein